MKLLFCGDIVGRSGRETIEKYVPKLREEKKIDIVIVNGENAASGFGITQKICVDLFENGVDLISSGNHIWDQKETGVFIDKEPRLIRPYNYSNSSLPGNTIGLHELKDKTVVILINLLGRLFMKDDATNPFIAINSFLKKYSLSNPNIKAIIVDMHAETTSEKNAMAQYLDGKVSLVVGTHTHIPTADTRILNNGTGFQTDLGMCGDYDSVIGMNKENIIDRFLGKLNPPRMHPSNNEGSLSSVLVEIDNKTGLTLNIERIILGPLYK